VSLSHRHHSHAATPRLHSQARKLIIYHYRSWKKRQQFKAERRRKLRLKKQQCVSWSRTGELRQLESNRGAASAGVEPGSCVSWNRTGELRQLETGWRLVCDFLRNNCLDLAPSY
jgi:hypothetical protein